MIELKKLIIKVEPSDFEECKNLLRENGYTWKNRWSEPRYVKYVVTHEDLIDFYKFHHILYSTNDIDYSEKNLLSYMIDEDMEQKMKSKIQTHQLIDYKVLLREDKLRNLYENNI